MNRLAKYYNQPTASFGHFPSMTGIDLFKEFLSGFSSDPLNEAVQKIDEGIQISLAVPGIEADKINVTADGNILRFSIGDESHAYSRSWKIPSDVISEEISAELKNGLLRIILPVDRQEPRKIPIDT